MMYVLTMHGGNFQSGMHSLVPQRVPVQLVNFLVAQTNLIDLQSSENNTCNVVLHIHRYIAEKTTKKGDDFMGRLFYPLHLISVLSGEEKAFTLLSHSEKTQHGTITLQLSIKAIKESLPMEVCLLENFCT